MTSGTTPGGGIVGLRPRSHARAVLLRDSDFLATRAPLKSAEIREALLDIALVFGAFLTASVTALGFVWAMFVLMFVRL